MSLAVLVALALPAAAQAAVKKPTVTTKAASDVTDTAARLNAGVNPRGASTTYFFQIGRNSAYGLNTPATSLAKGAKAVNVSFLATGLTPNRTYHYRVVAQNRKGLTKGGDRTFKTKRTPLGLVLSAPENPVPFNASTTLTGQLTGTGNANQQVVLQGNAWPFTAGFQPVGNPLVTDPAGGFAFPLIGLQVNTQYRVVMPDRASVVSPVLPLGVKVHVSSSISDRTPKLGRRVTFSGRVTPSEPSARAVVQKLVSNVWTDVSSTALRTEPGATTSTFSRRLKLRHGGSFRVLVVTDGAAHVSNNGRSFKVKLHH